MTTPPLDPQQPAVYNAGVGYPVNDSVDGNLTLVDVYGTGQYGNLTARSVTAPFLAGLQPSGDPTGATDVANVNNLLGTFGMTDLQLGPGQWFGTAQVNIPISTLLHGSGPGTVWNYSGSGSAFYHHDLNGTGGSGGFGSYHTAAGGLEDMIIDGTGAGAAAKGYDVGDGWGFRTRGLRIQNFTGATAVGLYNNNQFGFTEKSRFQATLWGNTTQCVLNGNNGGQQSFEFNSYDFDIFMFAGQNGVSAQNGAFLNKGTLRIVGNALAGTSSLAANFVLQFTGSAAGSNSRMQRGIIDINVELDTTNTFAPQTINFGGASNSIIDCTGSLVFDPSASAVNFLASNATAGQFTFGGVIAGDATLQAINGQAQGWIPPNLSAVSLALSGAYTTAGAAVSITDTSSSGAASPVQYTAAAAADAILALKVTGDTVARFKLDSNGKIFWGPGNGAQDAFLSRASANLLQVGTADLDIATIGRGLRVAEGANAKQGIATLVAGTVTVANTSVTANSRIIVTCQILGTVTVASAFDTPRTAGVSFTIHASQATDTSTVAWVIFEPG